ncbi:MAG: hypothetical protein M1358_23335 [Chloroflexi bacterium]|nr:hypothetical protein [Chloroflexota bacterium]
MTRKLFNTGDLKIWRRLPVEASLLILLASTVAFGFGYGATVWFLSFLFLLWLTDNTQPIVDQRVWHYLLVPLTLLFNRWVVRAAMLYLLFHVWWTGGPIYVAIPVVGAMIFLLPMSGFFLKLALRKLPKIPGWEM